jgi:hypothetical protein
MGSPQGAGREEGRQDGRKKAGKRPDEDRKAAGRHPEDVFTEGSQTWQGRLWPERVRRDGDPKNRGKTPF